MSLHRRLLLLLCCCFLVLQGAIIFTASTAAPQQGDVIIVLGARLFGDQPSSMLRLRLEKAVELYQAGYAPAIIVSGGQGPDEAVSEAAAMRAYLVSRGVPPEAITMEDQSVSTRENLQNSQQLMQRYQWRQAIIVTNRSHLFRSLLLARLLDLPASGAAAPMADNVYLLIKQHLRESAAIPAALIRH